MKKNNLLLCLFLVAVYAVIGFFTFTILSNQKQEAVIAQRENAETEVRQLSQFITDQLDQVKSQLSAITQFLNIETYDDLQLVIERTPMIKDIFILDNHHLIYPTTIDEQSANNVGVDNHEQWLKALITPFIDDPSRLIQQASASEGNYNDFGWYNALLQHQPALVYWQKKDNLIIGYVLSYSTFRAKLIANVDNLGVDGQYQLFDNGKLLLSNQRQNTKVTSNNRAVDARLNLPYPLQQWSIDNTAKSVTISPLPLLLSAFALIGVITLIAIVIYRHTQRRIRLAAKQVQFVGQVSHELKTPLTNIRLYAELLSESDTLDDTESRYLNVITDEAKRLTRLIQNVLNFSKSSIPHVEDIVIADLLEQVKQMFTPTFADKKLLIRINNSSSEGAVLQSDKDMIVQILGNLLSNAEKYASNGEYVDIEANMDNNFCTINIRDYGPGMSKNELKHIFKPFYRVHNHLTEGVAGTGIGLTIARQLADVLGAQLVVDSCQPGIRFSLILPKTGKIISNDLSGASI